jgi:hypothetical protein
MGRNNTTVIFVLLTTFLLIGACSFVERSISGQRPDPGTNVPAVPAKPATENPATEVPVTESPATESPVNVDKITSACLSQLEVMLNDEGEWAGYYGAPEVDDEYTLVTYQVSGDEISTPDYETDIPDDLLEYQQDTHTHEYLWRFFTDIIPADQRGMISEFIIFTDGVDNVIGATDEADIPDTWTLELDILDSEDLPLLATTLVHEFGHMLTLNDQQLDYETSTCSTYETLDGCSADDSYINDFYDAFWTDIYDEWEANVLTADGEVDEDEVYNFYDQYPDQFLTDYAPTGPEEDIAESWIYFVMGPKPAGDTIAEQKILFFYDYPELVTLRQQILNGMCQYTE